MLKVHILKVERAGFVNYSYIVAKVDSTHALLIDPAWRPEIFRQTISEYGLRPSAILLTHHHYDHVNLAPYLSRFYNIPIYGARRNPLL